METMAVTDPDRVGTLPEADRAWLARYCQAANYLATAQIYLKDNFLLEAPLRPDHIKDALLGHWGTAPGLNFIYAHLNRLITRHDDASVLLITGPGHGHAAILANLLLEGTLADYYPDVTPDRAGAERLIRRFCWPGGFPSHLNPGTPGCLHEGGELGYALATAFGAAFDNPDLIVACVVGDGEAETGPTAAAWHGTKFLNPASDGAVLPILHANGYKIASPTIFGTMTDAELTALFSGYGYAPTIVGSAVGVPPDIHNKMAAALEGAHAEIRRLQAAARGGAAEERPRWPLLILRTPKGWTGIKDVAGVPIEGSYRAHQVPVKDAKTNPASLALVEAWLRSYEPRMLFDGEGRLAPDLLRCVPQGDRRIGQNPHALGGNLRRTLALPAPADLAVAVDPRARGQTRTASTEALGAMLREVLHLNAAARNFRIVSPDELESNRLGAVLEATHREYEWPVSAHDDGIGPGGRVLEVLSEHNCQGWLHGYVLTGRHGLFPSYEAFLPIVDGMVSQYAKFIEQSWSISWRPPLSSLNYLLSSTGWRQDHNGLSHQNPGFLHMLLSKGREQRFIRVFLPADANSLLVTTQDCLLSTDRVNAVVADKQPLPQWLTLGEAFAQARTGMATWDWACLGDPQRPEVVLASCGDHPTLEALAAVQLLRRFVPELRLRFVNVSELNVLGSRDLYPHAPDDATFTALFTADRPIVFTFHGYPTTVKQLIADRPNARRFQVVGYVESGATTTPFDMQVRNGASRYHLAMRLMAAVRMNPAVAAREDEVAAYCQRKLAEHQVYILEHGIDPDEITGWSWS